MRAFDFFSTGMLYFVRTCWERTSPLGQARLEHDWFSVRAAQRSLGAVFFDSFVFSEFLAMHTMSTERYTLEHFYVWKMAGIEASFVKEAFQLYCLKIDYFEGFQLDDSPPICKDIVVSSA